MIWAVVAAAALGVAPATIVLKAAGVCSPCTTICTELNTASCVGTSNSHCHVVGGRCVLKTPRPVTEYCMPAASVARYTFRTDFTDSSGNGNTLNNLQNMLPLANGVVRFSGADRLNEGYLERLTLTSAKFEVTNTITLSTWFMLEKRTFGFQGIISLAFLNYRLMVHPNLHPYYDAGRHCDVMVGDVTFQLLKWYHFVLTVTGGSLAKVYINGVLVSSRNNCVPSRLPPSGELLLGTGERDRTHQYTLEGWLGETIIYNEELQEDVFHCIPLETPAPPTPSPPTPAPPTPWPATSAPPTPWPATPAPPTPWPATPAPPTIAPTAVPTPAPPVDECADMSVSVVCTAARQTCVDPDHSSGGNWQCVCPLPSTAVQTTAASTDCDYDECSVQGSTCTMAGQACKDTDLLAADTWQCECIAPQTGATVVGAQAVCVDPPGDCVTKGDICHSKGQACSTGTTKFDGNVVCECIAPATGTPGQNVPAVCVLDECTLVCASCARTTVAQTQTICADAMQDCEDPNTDHLTTRDWSCKCRTPHTGTMTVAAAVCQLDECKADCTTCASNNGPNTCEASGQACVEKSMTVASDWECHCVDPKVGTNTAAIATCTEDECRTHGQTCITAGQTCLDADQTKAGTWTCVCALPSVSTAVAKVAVCEVDECTLPNVATVCTSAQQTCVDTDLVGMSNWECHCVAPASGTGAQHAVLECTLDECAVQCVSCADKGDGKGNVCTAAGQLCSDPKATHIATNDWMCVCVAPSTKTAMTAAVADCGTDECVERSDAVLCTHAPRYSVDGCLCKCGWTSVADQQTTPCQDGCCNPQSEPTEWCLVDTADAYNVAKTGCASATKQYCIPVGQTPQDGGRPARAAIPGVPQGQTNVCTDVGQKCVDPDEKSFKNWQCECVLPKTGTPGTQAAAVCEEDECVTHGAVCTVAGQTCKDTDRMGMNNWVCECTVGPPTTGNQALAVCTLDECLETCPTCASTVCTDAGQTCNDANQGEQQLGDWTCTCTPPSRGSATGGPMTSCVLDECVETCATCHTAQCSGADQSCVDPDTSETGTNNWRCVCLAPSLTTALINTAVCENDECAAGNNNPPCAVGQVCVDPDFTNANDWRCECTLPTTGSALMTNATCETDECKDHEGVCMLAGQHCVDADKTTPNNWVCECISPDLGTSGAQAAGDCRPSAECVGNKLCTDASQHCVDPDATKLDDWECHCIAPLGGTPQTKALADCTIDECVSVCPSCALQSVGGVTVCATHGQTCQDMDQKTLNDWSCVCPPPSTGDSATGTAATCVTDECTATCATCAGMTCTAAGQTCVDVDQDPKVLSNWECHCAAPSQDKKTGAAVDVCRHDECLSPVMCGAGQVCQDKDQVAANSWECVCQAPYSGVAAQSPVAQCSLNECTTTCAACADTGSGNVCVVQGQRCVEPDIHIDADWYCECTEGTGVSVGSAVALCVLDECAVSCPTCADTGGGNICTLQGQTCVDPDTNTGTKSDWECVCPAPFADKRAQAGLAVCSADECTESLNGTVNGAVCTVQGQLCNDAHPNTVGDFECICAAPWSGTKTGSPADCTKDECTLHGTICTAVGQTCLEPNTTNDNDWQCLCAAPSTSSRLGAAAVCEVDECIANLATCEGGTPPQDCVDTDKTTNDTWECRCRTPSSGTALAKAAACVLDECSAPCSTCENDVCSAAGQTCKDPNPAYTSPGDWTCVCAAPSTATAVGAVSACPVDECVLQGYLCQQQQQTCLDVDQGAASLGDWVCNCIAPQTGTDIAKPAQCEIDECTQHGHVCTDVGQTCLDPNTAVLALNDWECHCVLPAPQMAVATPATCVHIGECTDPVTNGVCESKGQVCVDPNMTVLHDWRCECTPPSIGAPKVGSAAVCALNECVGACATCAKDVCTAAGQSCTDANQDPVTGLNSWECRCAAPYSGSKIAAAATCALDECTSHGATCTSAGQDCLDPSTTTDGDWRCECRKPSVGTATASVASCQTNECEFHEKTCHDKGQTCKDPDTSAQALGDWTCVCALPWTGTAQAAAAKCLLDECTLYGSVCTAAGQTCTDQEQEHTGFWKCFCPAPNQNVGRDGTSATCIIDECVVVTNTSAVAVAGQADLCLKNGQTCSDPNTNATSVGDWVCTCPAPSTTTAVANKAVCEWDECLTPANAAVCTAKGQLCVDADWTTNPDWTCGCTLPSIGKGLQKPAACELDECKLFGQVCLAVGQRCVDADKFENATWTCECVAHTGSTASQVGGVADCTPPSSECNIAAVLAVCTAANQACFDPDIAASNDWVCECVPPAVGTQKTGAATQCTLDECAVDCPSCGKSICDSAGQECTDTNTDAASLGDWMCVCPAPSSGSSRGTTAVCTLDECAKVCKGCPQDVCAAGGTTCVDPNIDARAAGDWQCECHTPAKGRATGAVPLCYIDECDQDQAGGKACTDSLQGRQTCSDPNMLSTSLGDWMCTCELPFYTIGTTVGSTVDCLYDECTVATIFSVCTSAGQVCQDSNVRENNTWGCHCPDRVTTFVQGKAVPECVIDECTEGCLTCADKGGGNVCTAAGQTCEDPNKSQFSLNDWVCSCPVGTGSAVVTAAVCSLDECSQSTNFGAHTCKHTPQFSVDGCACQCGWTVPDVNLFPGAHGPGVDTPCTAGCCNPSLAASGPWCLLNPIQSTQVCKDLVSQNQYAQVCKATAAATPVTNICTEAQQVCVDPDTRITSVGDWRCECDKPATGAAGVAKPAVCQVDECDTQAQVCSAVGQVCEDTDKASDNTWYCRCSSPATGSEQGKAAVCKNVGDCDRPEIAAVCTQAGQSCEDPDPSISDDWVCKCVLPTVGVPARGSRAICSLNECTAKCATCADTGNGNICDAAQQKCVEGSMSPGSLGDWKCTCTGDYVGEATTAVAVCSVDECLLNNGRAAQVCGAAGQNCEDPNTLVIGGMDNWECVCPNPSVGRTARGVAVCRRDECQEKEVFEVCTREGQTCEDANTDAQSTGDWKCKCATKPGQDPKTAVAQAAVCQPPGAWCNTNGATCTALNQQCMPADSLVDPGTCMCIAPETGDAKVGAAAKCILDECVAKCATCADKNDGNGNICTQAGETCVEGSTDPKSVSDWRCKCAGVDGVSAVAAVAICTLNECDTVGKVCLTAGQACEDQNTAETSLGDWMCTCHAPATGSKVAGVATCTFDECFLHGATCTRMGQTCHDVDTSALVKGDWECRCVLPAEGSAVGTTAVCVFNGECHKDETAAVCTNAGQTCVDPNPAKDGDWECRCVSPQGGVHGKQAPATCTLDECSMTCQTCATRPGSLAHECTSVGQDCVDPNTATSSFSDWSCVCRLPAVGTQVAAKAACNVDECASQQNRAICAAVTDAKGNNVQQCVDNDQTTEGDWTCECLFPYHGTPTHREASICLVDECTAPDTWSGQPNGNSVCGKAGQTCLDPQQGVSSKFGNWVCQCPNGQGAPSTGKASTACDKTTLCATHGSKCGAIDMCVEKGDVWKCQCIPPFVGETVGAAATCVLDECTAECTTCAQQGSTHVCAGAGQKCVDHDTSPNSRSDWSCVCTVGKGEAALHAAVCTVDECALNSIVCEAKGQECVDPNTAADSKGDWVCRCVRPASGQAVVGAATCLLDECLANAGTCTGAGQLCIDTDTSPASLNDWTCNCPSPTSGVMYTGPAACTYMGACKEAANLAVCTDAGQRCVSEGATQSDFKCACMPPFQGADGSRQPAQCTINECDAICNTCARTSATEVNVCAGAGQVCEDPNQSSLSLSDWVCRCQAPATTTALASAVPSCLVDECLSVTQTGARKCDHFNRFTLEGCECGCGWRADVNGKGPGVSEACNTGCCNPTGAKEGDWCLVADSAFNRNSPSCKALINKQQTCASELTPLPAGAPTPAHNDVCQEAGQRCVDPNHSPSVQGDWECHCTHSEEFHVLAQATCSMQLIFSRRVFHLPTPNSSEMYVLPHTPSYSY